MKRALFLMILLAALCLAQTPQHSVVLTWTDPNNPTGTMYTVYRIAGVCPSAPSGFTKLQSGIAALTYTDTTVTPGPYCFYVTATVGGVESRPSPMVNPTVPAFAPATLGVTSVQ